MPSWMTTSPFTTLGRPRAIGHTERIFAVPTRHRNLIDEALAADAIETRIPTVCGGAGIFAVATRDAEPRVDQEDVRGVADAFTEDEIEEVAGVRIANRDGILEAPLFDRATHVQLRFGALGE
jgi:hypothetical protein